MAKAFEVGFVFGGKTSSGFKNSVGLVNKSLEGIKNTVGSVIKGVIGIQAIKGVLGTTAKFVEQFGELEQNLGGAEAVFGEYAASIQRTGENAYKNLGVSQSDYLATANKMGALFQGSGIEQQKSLELTEKAMQRATDMASVMGIDTQIALDSVAGAAKGNFTMMDNLGVAMNATTIEAYALNKGMSFKWKTASQAEKAEVAMEMFFESTQQYAGNFAREATETVSGSIGLLKASWGSFTAGLGNEKADMGNLTGNVIDAFGYVVDNVKPIVKNIAHSIPEAFGKAFVKIFPAAEPVINNISQSAERLFNSIGDNGKQAVEFIKNKWEEYGPAIISFATKIKNKAVLAFNWIRDTGKEAIDKIQTKFIEIKPHIQEFIDKAIEIGTKIKEKIQEAFEAAKPAIEWVITDGLPLVVGIMDDVLVGITGIYNFFNDNWSTIEGLVIAVGLAFAAWNLPTVLSTGIESIMNIYSAVFALPGKIVAVTTAWWGSVSAKVADKIVTLQLCGLYVKDFFIALLGHAKAVGASTVAWIANKAIMIGSKVAMLALKGAQLISAGATAAMTAAQWALNAAFVASPIGWIVLGIIALVAVGVLLYKNWDAIKAKGAEVWESLKGVINSFINGFKEKFPMLSAFLGQVFEGMKVNFTNIFEGVKTIFSGIITFVKGIFTGDWAAAWEGVKGIFKGIVDTLVGIFKSPINGIISLINGVITGINGIKFPDWVPAVGGKGINIPTIPMLATGGVVTGPTMAMVGEGSESEAVLPLSKLQGLLDLKEGSTMGLLKEFFQNASSVNTGGDRFIFSPQIVVEGGGNADSQVRNIMPDLFSKFKEFMEKYERDRKRKGLD